MDIKEIISNNLKRIRSERNLTQEQLAEKCEMSKSMIGRIESCSVGASVNTLEIICIVLNIRPYELLIEAEDLSRLQNLEAKKLKEDLKELMEHYGVT